GLRPERVAHLRPVERDAHGAGVDGAVVGDVGEVEAGDRLPRGGVEDLGDHARASTSFPHARPGFFLAVLLHRSGPTASSTARTSSPERMISVTAAMSR